MKIRRKPYIFCYLIEERTKKTYYKKRKKLCCRKIPTPKTRFKVKSKKYDMKASRNDYIERLER